MYKGLTPEEQRMMQACYSPSDDPGSDQKPHRPGGKFVWAILFFILFAGVSALFFYAVGLRRGSFDSKQIWEQSQMNRMMLRSDSIVRQKKAADSLQRAADSLDSRQL